MATADPVNQSVVGRKKGGLLGKLKRVVSLDNDVDLDGLPIKNPGDGKIDIKDLLKQGSSIDEEEESVASDKTGEFIDELVDSDEEYEFGSDDDEDTEARERKLPRHSSLKLVRTTDRDRSISDGYLIDTIGKKAVKFADALGLGLEDVRDLLNPEEPPRIPSYVLRDLHIRKRRSRTEGRFTLTFDFEPPGCRMDFIGILLTQKVVLENCLLSDKNMTISGLVRVVNIAFDKEVLVRYTTDHWLTSNDLQASYVTDSSDGTSDRFSFIIHLPDAFGLADARLGVSSSVEFVLSYKVGTASFWDNNNGDNYIIYCKLLDLPSEQNVVVSSVNKISV